MDQLSYCINYNRLRQAGTLLPVLAMGLSPVWSADRPTTADSTTQRSFSSRPVRAVTPPTVQPTDTKPAPVRTAQIDSHGRYPFGQFRGGYRYPFSYPYYRYGGSRHYPYSSRVYPFGVGPYGPYGSNYGGYSGNAYDPNGYTGPSVNGPALPDAPPATPPDDDARPARAALPAISAPTSRRAKQSRGGCRVGFHLVKTQEPALEVPPVAVGPAPYFRGNPLNAAAGYPFYNFGSPYLYSAYPFGSFGNSLSFGPNRFLFGFGMFPLPPYYDYPDGLLSDSGLIQSPVRGANSLPPRPQLRARVSDPRRSLPGSRALRRLVDST